MPEAVATTKRRYHKALDAFTNTSQVSLTTSTSNSTLAAKRPATAAAAFDEARERAAKRLRHSTSSSSLPRTSVPSQAPSQRDDRRSNDPPNFAPWSHDAFLARLKTFSSVSLWHPKPEAIGEVEWAKRGWVCVDVNTVGCRGGCERRVVVSLSLQRRTRQGVQEEGEDDGEGEDQDADDAAFEQALAERYKKEIIDGHSGNCMWRKASCKDNIYRLQVVRPSVWQPELRKRFQSVLELGDSIEKVSMKPLDRTDSSTSSSEKLLEDLPGAVLSDSAQGSDTYSRATALEVALQGWRGSSESGNELLNCDACFQRIGLWMYQSGYRPSRSTSDEEDVEDSVAIDLIEMHREHCPWRNPATQQASGSLSGLNASQFLQRVVSTYARDHRRRTSENLAVETGQQGGDEEETPTVETPILSREEVARQDKDRESRIRKLKSLFNIKRRSNKAAPKAAAPKAAAS